MPRTTTKKSPRDWLRTPIRKPSKEAAMALAGTWKDHEDADEVLKVIYRKCGRPMTEEDE